MTHHLSEAQFAKVFLEIVPPLVRFVRSEIRAAAPGALTVPQFRVLANIHRGMNTVSEIAENHGVSQPAMTKMVNGLVQRGLVKRTTNRDDVRETLLTLTAKGQRLYRATWNRAQKRLAVRLRVIPAKEREAILRALLKIKSIL